MTFLRIVAAALLAAAGAVAQTSAPTSMPASAPASRPVISRDWVEAMVGDRAILHSTVQESMDAAVGEMNDEQRRAHLQDTDRLRVLVLREIAHREAEAQSSRQISENMREDFQRIERQQMDLYQEQQIQNSGSTSDLARELELQGKSWDTERARELAELRRQLNIDYVMVRRYQQKFSLMVTPAEMLEFYNAHRDEFVRTGTTDLEFLKLEPLPDDDDERFGRRVREAARRWAAGEPVADLERDVQNARALEPRQNVRDVPQDNTRPEFKAFAGRAQLNEVSAPIRIEGVRGVFLLKVVRKEADRNDAFSNPKVQEHIAKLILRRKSNELRLEIREHHERNLVFWPDWLALRSR